MQQSIAEVCALRVLQSTAIAESLFFVYHPAGWKMKKNKIYNVIFFFTILFSGFDNAHNKIEHKIKSV